MIRKQGKEDKRRESLEGKAVMELGGEGWMGMDGHGIGWISEKTECSYCFPHPSRTKAGATASRNWV